MKIKRLLIAVIMLPFFAFASSNGNYKFYVLNEGAGSTAGAKASNYKITINEGSKQNVKDETIITKTGNNTIKPNQEAEVTFDAQDTEDDVSIEFNVIDQTDKTKITTMHAEMKKDEGASQYQNYPKGPNSGGISEGYNATLQGTMITLSRDKNTEPKKIKTNSSFFYIAS